MLHVISKLTLSQLVLAKVFSFRWNIVQSLRFLVGGSSLYSQIFPVHENFGPLWKWWTARKHKRTYCINNLKNMISKLDKEDINHCNRKNMRFRLQICFYKICETVYSMKQIADQIVSEFTGRFYNRRVRSTISSLFCLHDNDKSMISSNICCEEDLCFGSSVYF